MPARCIAASASAAKWSGRAGRAVAAALAAALDYIRDNPQIWEVILTGGDPLVLSPRRLNDVMTRLAAIDHVKVIRVHTRLPVAAPERVTAALVRALRSDKATFVVLHANHPRELTGKARAACARFIDAGIPMLSQSVLLRGVNDDVETLGALMRALVECRIKPYYLHHADLAPGTAHLRTSIAQGQSLDARVARPLFRTVPAGLCARYSRRLRQIAGRPELSECRRCHVEDFNGRRHTYPPRGPAQSDYAAAAAGKHHGRLEPIAAGLARPGVPHAAFAGYSDQSGASSHSLHCGQWFLL